MSQTTHTTMSSLTTPDGEDDDVVELVETPLPPLKSVFDCPNIELCIVNGKSGWKCHWCGQSFTPVHATRAIAHLLKKKKCDIKVCMAIIPKPSLVQYEALFDASRQSKDARKCHHEFVMDNVDNDQRSAFGTMLDQRWGLTVDVPHVSIDSGVCSGLSNAIGSNGHPVTYSCTKRSYQPSISKYLHPSTTSRIFTKATTLLLSLPLLISYIVRTSQIEWLSLQGLDVLSTKLVQQFTTNFSSIRTKKLISRVLSESKN